MTKATKDYYQNNKEKIKKSNTEWAKNNPEKSKEYYLRYHRYRKYGIRQPEYDELLSKQKGVCAICKKSVPILAVDHNHETGAIRGLLCKNCNLALGFISDDINIAFSMIEYLKENQ